MIQERQHHREQSDRVRKAEEETEDFHVRKIELSFSQQLLQYRKERQWKQVDLARFLCIKPNDLAALESGKAVYDGQLIHRIKMKLKL